MTNTPELLKENVTNFEQYTQLAIRTESPNNYATDIEMLNLVLRINIASAEILDGFKKQIFYNKEDKLQNQTMPLLGDIALAMQMLVVSLHGAPQEDGTFATTGEEGFHFAEQISEDKRRIVHSLLGIITESGELGTILGKITLGGEEVDTVNLQEEFNDINWYQAIGHDAASLDYLQGLTNNINKLKVRFPDKFSNENAAERDLETEREVLSNGIEE